MIYFISLFATGVIVFPIYIIRAQMTANSRHQEKLYQKAVSRGHVATAILKRAYTPSLEDPKSYLDTQQLGKYYFEYGGKKYNIRLSFYGDPPYEVQVYWLRNPKRAGTRGGIEDLLWPWLVAYLIVFFIVLLIATS